MHRLRCCCAAVTLLLAGCGLDNKYYVRTDGSPDVLTGVAHLLPPRNPPAPLDVGVTFKSDGRVSPGASDTLYLTVRDGLSAKGRWAVRRLGRPGDDFAAVIQAVARAGGVPPRPATARLLMLVENAPDLSMATRSEYFLSGFSLGAWSRSKPTDRYDVTIAYRDPQGVERVYRSHQDLYFTTGSRLFGTGGPSQPDMKPYGSILSAFGGIVDNSVNGARRGTVTAGQPRFETPGAAKAAPAAAPQPAAPAKP